jgi:hypothetical protein
VKNICMGAAGPTWRRAGERQALVIAPGFPEGDAAVVCVYGLVQKFSHGFEKAFKVGE